MVGGHSKSTKTLQAILLVIGGIFAGFPILWMICSSFKSNAAIFSWPPKLIDSTFSFHSFTAVLTDASKVRFFLNSYIVAGCVVILTLFIGILAAYAFSRFDFPGKTFFNSLIVSVQAIPPIVLMIPYMSMIVVSYEKNVAICQKVCELAHSVNVSVEGELGTIGVTDSVETTSPDKILYTDPDQARDFVERTGIDCLAIAIGTSHGIYPKGKKPELRIDVLDSIKKVVSIPLVLHGGSSNKDSEITKAVEHGVNKINISSDTKAAYFQEMREVLKDPMIREPNAIQPRCLAAMKEVAFHKIELFQADGKASLY